MRALAHLRSEVKDFFDFALIYDLVQDWKSGKAKVHQHGFYSRLSSTYPGITYVDWWGFRTDSKVDC